MVMGTKKSHGMLMVVPRNPGGPHADDGQRPAVRDEHGAYRVSRSAELGLPQVVTQDDDRMAADRLVDLGTEQAAGRRQQTQGRKVRARDLGALHSGGAALMGHVGAGQLHRRRLHYLGASILVTRPTLVSPAYRLSCLSMTQ